MAAYWYINMTSATFCPNYTLIESALLTELEKGIRHNKWKLKLISSTSSNKVLTRQCKKATCAAKKVDKRDSK